MKPIQIISASAGSGKTYRLTEILEQCVVDGEVRPHAVLATTFTNKSAAELQERVRVRLLQAGRVEAAQQLSAARIGTVNSVCGRLVSDFAFELGLSPELRVLDEEPAKAALMRCISAVLAPAEETELADLTERMVAFDWQQSVRQMVSLARANRIPTCQLCTARDRSRKEFRRLLGSPSKSEADLDAALLGAMKAFLTAAPKIRDTTKMTKGVIDSVKQCVGRMDRGVPLAWSQWVALAKDHAAKASDGILRPVREAASAHDRHPRLHRDAQRAIELVFDLAARTLDFYQEHKRGLGAIDFVDQETYALQLLETQDVTEQLGGELDLVLIDEFQDTSPIQLAIFLRLAEAARRSVWVGDQKQAIYGFRGTDPMLMDAAMAEILNRAEPETLPTSYRSRPGLVRFTSALFAPAFEQQGIPASRVNLKPALVNEPPGLGVFLECWPLTAHKNEQETAALAGATKQLLEDKSVRVRDRLTDQPRLARPGDVAILCRTNNQCLAVAGELAAIGIRPVLPRQGLCATLEGRAALAGLRLWVDGGDSLSAAELARLIDFAGREDAWLQAVLERPGDAAFADLPRIARIQHERQAAPNLGVLGAFDAVAEAIGLADLCLGWGDAEARLANLESLRSHAVRYVNSCSAEGAGCTAAGLTAWLVELQESEADSQGVDRDDHAVVVSTWHGAKGLEWPIVVLYPLSRFNPATRALGAHVQSDRPKVMLDDPLAQRWVRFWPNPYHAANNATPFHVRLVEHAATTAVSNQAAREDLRLLYVGWTRARDRVVLADREGCICDGMLQLLHDGKQPLVTEPAGKALRWAGQKVDIVIRKGTPLPAREQAPNPGVGYVASGPREYPLAFVQPSAAEGSAAKLMDFERIGRRIAIAGDPDWPALGMAIHGVFCADRPEMTTEQRTALVKETLSRWDVADAVNVKDVARAGEMFRQWVTGKWPGAEWCREWPVLYRDENGSVIRGSSDLALQTSGGLVVIDHKSFPGNIGQALARASQYTGQLLNYAKAIEAAMGRRVSSRWVHLPISGIVVPLPR